MSSCYFWCSITCKIGRRLLRCFPRASEIEKQMFPAVPEVVDVFARVGLDRRALEVIPPRLANSLAEYAAKLHLRAISTFEFLTAEQTEQGCAALDAAVAAERTPRPVEGISDLLVLADAPPRGRAVMVTSVSTFIKNLTFDCGDALRVATFWASVLGSNVDEDSTADKAYVEAPGWGGPNMWFNRVPEGKIAKNRIHLDLRAPSSVDDEIQRLVGLGATVVRPGQDLVVMQDPEGNEFCVE